MAELQARLDRLEAQYKADKSRAHLEEAFRLIDANGDGSITKDELMTSMRFSLGDDAEFAARFMIMIGDKNNDDVLSLDEFVEVMAKAFEQ